MSETPEGYGTQSTPDMGESYPPQTGDLLGAYVARLAARVRELEGTLARFLTAVENANSYQADYGHRIVKLEESRKLGETPIENIDQLTVIINNWCSDLREWTGVVVRLEARVRELEAASIEPSAYQRSLEARIERLEQAAQPEPTAEPAVTTPAVCATCGHEWRDHSDTGGICMGGVMGKPCRCTEYKPVASEG